MEKNTIWVVVTWDDEASGITSKKSFKTKEEAVNDVDYWFNSTTEEYDAYGYDYRGDGWELWAYVEHDGIYEHCEAFEVDIP